MTQLALTVLRLTIELAARTSWCRLIGHDWSWPHGARLGVQRPACRRCHKVA